MDLHSGMLYTTDATVALYLLLLWLLILGIAPRFNLYVGRGLQCSEMMDMVSLPDIVACRWINSLDSQRHTQHMSCLGFKPKRVKCSTSSQRWATRRLLAGQKEREGNEGASFQKQEIPCSFESLEVHYCQDIAAARDRQCPEAKLEPKTSSDSLFKLETQWASFGNYWRETCNSLPQESCHTTANSAQSLGCLAETQADEGSAACIWKTSDVYFQVEASSQRLSSLCKGPSCA